MLLFYVPEKSLYKVIFLCTGNSCRSQMAEGFARELGKGIIEPYSAGLTPCYVHPRAVEVMREIGIDISMQKSKAIAEELLMHMDLVITLCGHADQSCPFTPPDVKKIHMPVDDPVGTVGTEEQIMDAFRRARDEIREMVQKLVNDIKSKY
jgi:arsenate reductase